MSEFLDDRMQEKFEHMKRALRLGMSAESAMIVAGITSEEAKELEDNKEFRAKCEFIRVAHEQSLLERMSSIMDLNTETGNSTEVRWMLERINPKRWGMRNTGKENVRLRVIEFLGPEDSMGTMGTMGTMDDDGSGRKLNGPEDRKDSFDDIDDGDDEDDI
jgi:hypothetical protein